MLALLFDVFPRFGLLFTVPPAIVSLIAGVLLIVLGQWALGIVLILLAAGLGFLAFKFWRFMQAAD